MCLAVPGQVIEINKKGPLEILGKVNFGGVAREVNLAYVPEVKIGDYVVVHVGFALSIIDEEEAQRIFEYVKQEDEENQR